MTDHVDRGVNARMRETLEFFIAHALATKNHYISRDILGISQMMPYIDQKMAEKSAPRHNPATMGTLRDCVLRVIGEPGVDLIFGMSWPQIWALQVSYEAQPELTLNAIRTGLYQRSRVVLQGVVFNLGLS